MTIYDAGGDENQRLESFGEVAPPDAAFELVAFPESVLVLVEGTYVMAPLRIEDAAFYVESGVFVTEADGAGRGQLPISIRGEDKVLYEDAVSTSRRFLSRTVRLYDARRELHSVTSGYHQYS